MEGARVDVGAYEFPLPNPASPLPPGVLAVDDDAAAGGTGLTWATAFHSLQDARAEASGGGITEIWLARGTYTPDRGAGLTPGNRSLALGLIDGVSIYGGFGCYETVRSAANPTAHVSTLYGDLSGNDGSDYANYGDNSHHVVTGDGVTEATTIEGVTIRGGNPRWRPRASTEAAEGSLCATPPV